MHCKDTFDFSIQNQTVVKQFFNSFRRFLINWMTLTDSALFKANMTSPDGISSSCFQMSFWDCATRGDDWKSSYHSWRLYHFNKGKCFMNFLTPNVWKSSFISKMVTIIKVFLTFQSHSDFLANTTLMMRENFDFNHKLNNSFSLAYFRALSVIGSCF